MIKLMGKLFKSRTASRGEIGIMDIVSLVECDDGEKALAEDKSSLRKIGYLILKKSTRAEHAKYDAYTVRKKMSDLNRALSVLKHVARRLDKAVKLTVTPSEEFSLGFDGTVSTTAIDNLTAYLQALSDNYFIYGKPSEGLQALYSANVDEFWVKAKDVSKYHSTMLDLKEEDGILRTVGKLPYGATIESNGTLPEKLSVTRGSVGDKPFDYILSPMSIKNHTSSLTKLSAAVDHSLVVYQSQNNLIAKYMSLGGKIDQITESVEVDKAVISAYESAGEMIVNSAAVVIDIQLLAIAVIEQHIALLSKAVAPD